MVGEIGGVLGERSADFRSSIKAVWRDEWVGWNAADQKSRNPGRGGFCKAELPAQESRVDEGVYLLESQPGKESQPPHFCSGQLLASLLVGAVVGGTSAPVLLTPLHLLGGAIPGAVLVGQGTGTGEVDL